MNERIDVIGVRTSWLTWLRKSSFCGVEPRQPLVGRAQLGGRRLDLARLRLELRRNRRDLLGLVGDPHELVDG